MACISIYFGGQYSINYQIIRPGGAASRVLGAPLGHLSAGARTTFQNSKLNHFLDGVMVFLLCLLSFLNWTLIGPSYDVFFSTLGLHFLQPVSALSQLFRYTQVTICANTSIVVHNLSFCVLDSMLFAFWCFLFWLSKLHFDVLMDRRFRVKKRPLGRDLGLLIF